MRRSSRKSQAARTLRSMDYLALVSPSKPLTYQFSSALFSSPNDALEAAITDVCVVLPSKGETLPEGYEMVRVSVGGRDANTNSGAFYSPKIFIGFRRRKESQRKDHITKLSVVYKTFESVPEGFEMITTSVGGHSANLNPLGIDAFLVVQREDPNAFGVSTAPSIVDISLVFANKGEKAPPDYHVVDKDLNKGSYGDTIYLCYRAHQSVGLCNIPIASETTDRFPSEDLPHFPLPSVELPMFCFPRGLKLKCASRFNAPMPSYFCFVFTDIAGRRNHVACLSFYDRVPTEEVMAAYEALFRQHGNEPPRIEMPADYAVFAPRCICVLSNVPFYRAMTRYLRQLYSISISMTPVPIEKFVASVISQVPIPLAGGRAFEIFLDWGLVDHSKGEVPKLPPILLQLSDRHFFPSIDLDFSAPLKCLSTENLIAVYTLLLQEHQCLFLCSSGALLTEVMETLRSLLFPFDWQSLFVPRLPEAVVGCLGAPGGYMVGVQVRRLFDSEDWKSVRSILIGSLEELQPEAYIIDLNRNVILNQSNETLGFTRVKASALLKRIPLPARKRLEDRLDRVASNYQLSPSTLSVHDYDSAFELAPTPSEARGGVTAEFPTLAVRDAFMCFNVEMFGTVDRFVDQESIANISSSTFDIQSVVDRERFVTSAGRQARPFMERVMDSQMFSVILQQKFVASAMDQSLVFYERCAKLYQYILDVANAVSRTPRGLRTSQAQALLEMLTDGNFVLGEVVHEKGHQLETAWATQDGVDDILADLLDRQRPTQLCRSTSERDTLLVEAADYSFLQRKDFSFASLSLANPQLEPLALPGPVQNSTTSGVVYTTWPEKMDPQLLQLEDGQLHALVRCLQAGCDELRQREGLQMLTRSISEQYGRTDHRGRKSFRHQLSKHLQDIFTRQSSSLRSSWTAAKFVAVRQAMEVYACVLLLLSIRIMKGQRPVQDILQCLGMLQHLQESGVLGSLDETTWRSLLVACGTCGGEFMRRIAMGLFDAMKSAGITPNMLTFGQYTNALAQPDTIRNEDTHTIHVDEHQRLERAGVTWYLSHLRNDQQSSPHSLQDALNDVSVGSLLRFILTSEDREPKRPHATDGFLSCKPVRDAFDEHRAMSQGDLFSARTASTGSTSEITLQEHKEAEPATTTSSTAASNCRVFGIHSMVTCVCGATLLDEEIMAFWCENYAEQLHSQPPGPGQNRMSDGKSSRAVRCSRASCCAAVIPMLHVYEYSMPDDATEHWEIIWVGHYYSPPSLRSMFEQLVVEVGANVLNEEWLRTNHAALYWNMVWYCRRLDLPLPFFHSPPVETEAPTAESNNKPVARHQQSVVVTAWVPSALRARCGRAYRARMKGEMPLADALYIPLDLSLVFPGQAPIVYATLANVKHSLTQPMNNMRNCLQECALLPKLPFANLGDRFYRLLLFLIYHYEIHEFLDCINTFDHLHCVSRLEEQFNQTISSHISRDQFKDMLDTTEQELRATLPSPLAVCLRRVFGSLM